MLTQRGGAPVSQYRDEVAACMNSFGKGRAYLIGTLLGPAAAPEKADPRNGKFLAAVLDRAGRLQRRRRLLGSKAAWFLCNTTHETVGETVFLEKCRSASDLLSLEASVPCCRSLRSPLAFRFPCLLRASKSKKRRSMRAIPRGVAAQSDICSAGGQAMFVPTDVRDESSIQRLIERAIAELGRKDLLCNNAGIQRHARADEYSIDDFNAIVETNLRGMFLCAKYAFPHLSRTKGSSSTSRQCRVSRTRQAFPSMREPRLVSWDSHVAWRWISDPPAFA